VPANTKYGIVVESAGKTSDVKLIIDGR